MNPKLSIIIVSWNVKKLLADCLESIFANQGDLNLEVIVIDNASKDKTTEMVEKKFPQVKLVTNKKNQGFAKANNQGIGQSRGDLILILNPDTKIIGNALPTMVNFINKNDRIGIAGCKHLNPDLTLQHSVRRFPTFWALFFILTKIAKLLPNLPPVHHYLAKDFNYKAARQVDQVAGSFMIVKKKVFDDIGLFDEKFFLWFEEVDLCKRTKNAGWQVWYNSEAEIMHYGGQSFSQQLTLKNQKIFFKSAWYYLKKHGFK